MLDLHRVWGFFREKLALRRLEELAPYLTLADEFAWACYGPAQRDFVSAEPDRMKAVREPPLVYLSAAASPFSVSRGESYADQLGPDGLTTRTTRLLVARLPIPVIGVPWFQLRHLPDALVIGHEVGHIVLNEMAGLEAVEALVDAALPADTSDDERLRWAGWAEEAFCDVYGALCGGAAYVTVLADFLSVDGADRDLTDPTYPPAALRIRLAQEAVHAAAGEDAGPPDPGVEHDVAAILVDGPYACFGGRGLGEVLTRVPPTGTGPRDLLRGWAPTTKDIRTLLAVTATAFADDPAKYGATGVTERVLKTVPADPAARHPLPRWGRTADAAAIERADAARVQDLYELLTEPANH